MSMEMYLIKMAGLVEALTQIQKTERVRRNTGGGTQDGAITELLVKRIIELSEQGGQQ